MQAIHIIIPKMQSQKSLSGSFPTILKGFSIRRFYYFFYDMVKIKSVLNYCSQENIIFPEN